MNRRQFLKAASGLLLPTALGAPIVPDEETVRRYWRGWSKPEPTGPTYTTVAHGLIPGTLLRVHDDRGVVVAQGVADRGGVVQLTGVRLLAARSYDVSFLVPNYRNVFS